MEDRHISQKLKGKVLRSCIAPAYGLETMAMTEVCERRIVGMKRIGKQRIILNNFFSVILYLSSLHLFLMKDSSFSTVLSFSARLN